MHAAVMSSFVDIAAGSQRILWRLDPQGQGRTDLYVMSPDRPDFTHVLEQAGWPTTQAWDSTAYQPFLDRLAAGQQWHFRLTANPVHKVRIAPDAVDTKLVAHVTVKRQEQWLLDRAEKHGFRPVGAHGGAGKEPDLVLVDRRIHRFRREENVVTLSVATFEGHLEVVDAPALRTALTSGVGRAKAYGCGLLTLAPVAGGR